MRPQLCYWRSLNPESVDARWLYYWMQGGGFREQVDKVKGNTDMADYVSLGDQRSMKITLPPLEVQHEVAAVLSSLDAKIEHNQRVAGELEALARSIFQTWFVDFAPVHAKAAGATSYPGLPPAAFAALPTGFEPAGSGQVPAGWKSFASTRRQPS